MTKQEVVTLDQVFSSGEKLSPKELKKAESSGHLAKVKEILSNVKVFWPAACDIILKKLLETLNVNMANFMVSTWNKYREIEQYTDAKTFPRTQTYMVPLTEHTIDASYEPSMEILVNNQPVATLNFIISVYLTLEGIILEIKGGKIMKLHTGSCKAGGSIMCEGQLIFEKTTSPFTLPGEIDLGKGILIPKLVG